MDSRHLLMMTDEYVYKNNRCVEQQELLQLMKSCCNHQEKDDGFVAVTNTINTLYKYFN